MFSSIQWSVSNREKLCPSDDTPLDFIGMKVLVRKACIAWFQTGHHGKIDDLTLKESLHYLIKICTVLFAFVVSEERNMFGRILLKFYHTDTTTMIFVPYECH
jgi:hypothetical protein